MPYATNRKVTLAVKRSDSLGNGRPGDVSLPPEAGQLNRHGIIQPLLSDSNKPSPAVSTAKRSRSPAAAQATTATTKTLPAIRPRRLPSGMQACHIF